MIDNEVRILRCVKHPNIIRLIEDFTNHRQIFYIMELVKVSPNVSQQARHLIYL